MSILWILLGGITIFIAGNMFLWFVLPSFSIIPYFPTNKHDIPTIKKHITLTNKMAFFDLGAGDGDMVFSLANDALTNKLDTDFYAIEINPYLVGLLHIKRLLHPNKKHIHIIKGDMFTLPYKNYSKKSTSNIFLYLYISPSLISEAIQAFHKSFSTFTAVSYMYPLLPHGKPIDTGIHNIYKHTFNR